MRSVLQDQPYSSTRRVRLEHEVRCRTQLAVDVYRRNDKQKLPFFVEDIIAQPSKQLAEASGNDPIDFYET